jgi:hypothetical protein
VSAFSQAFVKLRLQAGFETAYQFYHKNGGPRTFQCSFPNYLRIEKGSHLPQPQRLPRLCALLRLPLGSQDLRKLLEAYIESWLGSKDLATWMLGPFASDGKKAQEAPLDPASRALRKVALESAKPISVKQYEAIMSSAGAYWCFRVLTTSLEAFTIDELVKTVELPKKEIEAGVEALRKCGIVSRRRDGRFNSPLAGHHFLLFPDSRLIEPEMMERVFKYNETMIKKRGKLMDVRYMGVRADEAQLQGFIPHFRETIRGLNAYAITEKTDRSGLFFVEGKIFKLFDF